MNARIALRESHALIDLTLQLKHNVKEVFIRQSASLNAQNVVRVRPVRETVWPALKHVEGERIVTIQDILSLVLLDTNVLVVLWQNVGKDIILRKVQTLKYS